MDKRAMRVQRNEERSNEVRRLKQLGLSYSQIGLEMGFSRQRAQQLVSSTPEHNKEIIKSANGICQKCGNKANTLNVHHINYIPDEHEVLCVSCHMSKHGRGNVKDKRYLENGKKNLIFISDNETKAQLKIISVKYNIPIERIIVRVWRNNEEKREFYFSG